MPCKAAEDMKDRIVTTRFIEVRLMVGHRRMNKPERADPAPQGQSRRFPTGEVGDVTEVPGRSQKSALARVHPVHRLTNVVRVIHGRLPVGVRTHPQSTWPNMIWPAAGDRPN